VINEVKINSFNMTEHVGLCGNVSDLFEGYIF
jgi:hypothetical protein